jgi:HEAT repeat protein
MAESASDDEAWGESAEVLTGAEPIEVRAAVAAGLGRSKAAGAVAPLSKAIDRGDPVSRDAAAALSAIATPEAIEVLTNAVLQGKPEAKIGAVVALSQVPDCEPCRRFLEEQYRSHPEKAIKDLIGAVTGHAKPHMH